MAIAKLRVAAALPLAGIAFVSLFAAGADPPSLPFQPGERLTYNVTWSVFQAGQVAALLEKTGSTPDDYLIVTTAQSRGFVSKLYTLNDVYRSRLNPQTMCSGGISKRVVEGRRRKQTEIVFDSSRRLAILDERNLAQAAEAPKHDEEPIPPCVQDVVSGFYYLRTQPMRVGDHIEVPVNDGSKTTLVTVEVQAHEEITTPLGRRYAFRVEPSVFGRGGVYKRQGRMLIWFSDDEQRLPLRIKAMLSVGTLTGALTSVTGTATIGPTPAAASGVALAPVKAADPAAPKTPDLN
jgi:Protein of unknown function (DUF3108)